MRTEILQRVLDEIDAKRAVVLATDLDSGEQRLLRRGQGENEVERARVERALRLDACVTSDEEDGPRLFYQPFNPPLRLIVVGAVHITQPLSAMATLSGYEVTVVDPRESFAAKDRFPGVALNLQWPDEALESLKIDARTAIVTLTHDPKLDDPALQTALRSEAFFIGSLGSRKTHGARLRRLTKAGFSQSDLDRIRGPVGLPIGARSPAEIAIAILAHITEAIRGHTPFSKG